jgi:hypothetical protein
MKPTVKITHCHVPNFAVFSATIDRQRRRREIEIDRPLEGQTAIANVSGILCGIECDFILYGSQNGRDPAGSSGAT